jgi:hypothetical protein
MTHDSLTNENRTEDPKEKVWRGVLRTSMALPGAKVNRAEFLRSQLRNYCNDWQVAQAIQIRPAEAGIPVKVIDRIATSCINAHVAKASGISFATGLPGGWAIAGTIPADLAFFYWNAFVLSQKLAYLYGWPDLLEQGEVDQETEIQITLLVGALMGSDAARRGLAALAERFVPQAACGLPRQSLTRYAIYNLTKQVGRWIGINITKRTLAGGIAKMLPILGGVMSASVTAGMMFPMAWRLKNHLRKLKYAKLDDGGLMPVVVWP